MVKRTVISSKQQFQVADVLFKLRRRMAASEIAGILHVPAKHLGSALSGLHRRKLILKDADGRWVWANIKKAPKRDEEIEKPERQSSLRYRLKEYFRANPGLSFSPEEIAEVLFYAKPGAL